MSGCKEHGTKQVSGCKEHDTKQVSGCKKHGTKQVSGCKEHGTKQVSGCKEHGTKPAVSTKCRQFFRLATEILSRTVTHGANFLLYRRLFLNFKLSYVE